MPSHYGKAKHLMSPTQKKKKKGKAYGGLMTKKKMGHGGMAQKKKMGHGGMAHKKK